MAHPRAALLLLAVAGLGPRAPAPAAPPVKPWPDTSDRVHSLIVGDDQMSAEYIASPAAHAKDVDLVWGGHGASFPADGVGAAWRRANPAAVLTRYVSCASARCSVRGTALLAASRHCPAPPGCAR